jgi:hypothetical protein
LLDVLDGDDGELTVVRPEDNGEVAVDVLATMEMMQGDAVEHG